MILLKFLLLLFSLCLSGFFFDKVYDPSSLRYAVACGSPYLGLMFGMLKKEQDAAQ